MATLTSSDYQWIVSWIRSSQYKDILKQSGLSKTQLFAAIQAIETWEVSGHNTTPTESRNSAIETAAGTTTTLAMEQAMWFAWSAWKSFSNREA